MIVRKKAKDTITAVELNINETLEFKLAGGDMFRMTVMETGAEVIDTTLPVLKAEKLDARTNYSFFCIIDVNGKEYRLEREVSTQKSFYEPYLIDGVYIWLDSVDRIFDFLNEDHGECRGKKDARFGLQDLVMDICPERLHPWCPLPEGGLRIEDCYNGEDCWLGAYSGASAHGGLDINHPAGTPIWAPLDIHYHYLFNSIATGHNNNRWRGIHYWENGSQWILQVHHIIELTVPEFEPVGKGLQFAKGAGVRVGFHEHSHFVFKIFDEGELVMLDPWILFWKMYRDLSFH